ncbi:hypothetical protein [Stieleria varia]|uniref:Uncharacterized protein n=1 Tax=Stieleria varia TaxID=2528005 RepID=A0A5C5ZR36_9BACT|nr:hypothetical protein [Stieleria varia]TWT89261.1 hypothetical protein Pla52n_68580 [Stieleria varia]
MDAVAFVNSLRTLMPSAVDLEEYGLDAEEIADVQSAFDAKQRQTYEAKNTEVEHLVTAFDCSSIAIGIVRFDSGVTSVKGGTRFAYCEADPLVVDGDGRILMLHHDVIDADPIGCAEDSERFLDAMLFAADAIVNRVGWKGRGIEVARECSERAGGSGYLGFYRSVVGGL